MPDKRPFCRCGIPALCLEACRTWDLSTAQPGIETIKIHPFLNTLSVHHRIVRDKGNLSARSDSTEQFAQSNR